MYDVQVVYSEAGELVTSLYAYSSNEVRAVLDLGEDWRQQVLSSIGHSIHEHVEAISKDIALYLRLSWQSPYAEVAGFLDWLRSNEHGCEPECASVEQAVWLMSQWHERYFAEKAPELNAMLLAARDNARSGIEKPQALVEALTGMRVYRRAGLDSVVLVPQFHASPWVLRDLCDGQMVLRYPADIDYGSDANGKRLLRVARALSDQSRLQIIRMLARKPMYFSEIVESSTVGKSTVHHHLVVLRAASLVRVHLLRDGRVKYCLAPAIWQNASRLIRRYVRDE